MAKQILTLDTFIPYRLSFTSNLVSNAMAHIYDTLFGLTIPQWRLIAVIAESEAIAQAEIGARTRMDKVTVSRAAIELTGRGLLARTANSRDGRSHLLKLTDDGRRLYEEVAPRMLELERRIFGSLSKSEIDLLLGILQRIDNETARLADAVASPQEL